MLHIQQKRLFLGELMHTLLAAMVSLALSLPHNKPFLGEQYIPHTAEETFPWRASAHPPIPAWPLASLRHNKPFLGEQYVPQTAEETFPWRASAHPPTCHGQPCSQPTSQQTFPM
jgi:hypothetical protein